jgi:hypothetical protein
MNKFGNLIFSVGEQEIIQRLQNDFGQSFTQAIDLVINQKRDASVLYRRQGNIRLADQLLKEIGDIK